MLVRKAYKYKLKVDDAIAEKLSQSAGCCRFVWNKAHSMYLAALEHKQPIPRYQENAFWLTLWKVSEEYGFLKDCHSQVLQQKLRDLDRAFMDCFDRSQPGKRLPLKRKRGIHDSFRYVQGLKVDNRRLYLPKIGWVGFFKSRPIEGKVKNVTISRQGNSWFASVQTEQEKPTSTHPSKSAIGIDMGVAAFATLSDGKRLTSPKAFDRYYTKLANAQRKLKRKKKFSANWRKQIQTIRAIHTKITNTRHDFLHKASTSLCKNHAIVAVEDLNITHMTTSARGSIDNPGKNVAQKTGLNRAVLDQGWYAFRRYLDYKLTWAGGAVIPIKITELRNLFLCAVLAATLNMPMSTPLKIFWRQGLPSLPVEGTLWLSP